MKTVLAVLFLILLIGYATWQKLQFLSLVALIALMSVLYQKHARRVLDLFLELLSNAKQAKYGALEIQIDKRLKDFSDLAVKKSVGVQILLSQLDSQHVSLLLAIGKVGHYAPPDPARAKLRDLRNRGLLYHNSSSLGASTEVWLTPLGEELAAILMETPVPGELQQLVADEGANKKPDAASA
jgi:hypothetical protein